MRIARPEEFPLLCARIQNQKRNKMKKIGLLGVALLTALYGKADQKLPKDTTKVVDIEEIVIIASPKENAKFRQLPASVSLLSQHDMQANQVSSLKNVSAIVPNFFMPDYGSKLTSAIYIRGIGARINTPAVGLYVDNIPYIDKSAFDFNFYDIERIDILRGPQGTLYGRNTMGGLIQVHTRSPFTYQGTDVRLGMEGESKYYTASLTHYHRINDKFAFSAGGFYENGKGFFRNLTLNKMADPLQAGGGRIRAIWLPTSRLKLDFTANYEYSDQGGYAYGLYDKETKTVGPVCYNDESSYRRALFNAGLNLEYQTTRFVLSAVTGYQNLNDRMFLDQDFTAANIYTISQKQKLNTLSEEITLKSKPGSNWQWATGVFGFYQWLNTDGPVTFKEEGVKNMIEGNVNRVFASLGEKAPQMSLSITDPQIGVSGNFDTPVVSGALYHQSTYNNLFIKGLSLTAGLRLEYEKNSLTYHSDSEVNFNFNIKIGAMPFPIPINGLSARPQLSGKESHDYWQLLPKIALNYAVTPGNNIYASVAKGYRSGGFNIQMFSDLISGEMQNGMIGAILEKGKNMPGNLEEIIKEHVPGYGVSTDIRSVTTYKPEYSWNYEVGAHLTLLQDKLWADVAAFFMDTHDQQIAQFAPTGLGRMMKNAGRSHSYGAEAALRSNINRHLYLTASYGYTHATFRNYNVNERINGQITAVSYKGRYVPMVPRHTLSIGGEYTFYPSGYVFDQLVLGINYSAAGKMYWTEKNDIAQDFYGTLNARISMQAKGFQVDIWSRNLLDKEYTAFYFESMGKPFMQPGKPRQIGIDLRYKF